MRSESSKEKNGKSLRDIFRLSAVSFSHETLSISLLYGFCGAFCDKTNLTRMIYLDLLLYYHGNVVVVREQLDKLHIYEVNR